MNFKPPNNLDARRRSPIAIEQALQQAALALQNARPAEAEWIAADILKGDPNESRALQISSNALIAQGRLADAIALLEKAVRRSHDPAVETQLALALKRTGRVEDALERLKRAIKRRPPFELAFLELGILLTERGQFDEAAEVLARGVELMPNGPSLWVQLGKAHVLRNHRSTARDCFTRVLDKMPNHAAALLGLARVMQSDGEYAAGAEVYRRFLAISAGEATAWIGLGTCLLELGQVDQATEAFRIVEQRAPQMYGQVLMALCGAGRGRFWLRPSAAARFVRGADR
jgi:tetratricopeptide (TPR) repeat protein